MVYVEPGQGQEHSHSEVGLSCLLLLYVDLKHLSALRISSRLALLRVAVGTRITPAGASVVGVAMGHGFNTDLLRK